jgi:hypothetical protein
MTQAVTVQNTIDRMNALGGASCRTAPATFGLLLM